MEHGGSSYESILEKILKLNVEDIARISGFHGEAEMDFHRLAGPSNVSKDLKNDGPCLWVFVYDISTWVERRKAWILYHFNKRRCD